MKKVTHKGTPFLLFGSQPNKRKPLWTPIFQTDGKNSIHDGIERGARGGVNCTPTFFINGVRHAGALDAATLIAALLLNQPTI